jgi:gluconolactonase
MVHGRWNSGPNPLKGWPLDLSTIRTIGRDLQRPECILAERDGTLWSADARGGVMQIRPDGTQSLVTQLVDGRADPAKSNTGGQPSETLPNGLAFSQAGDILIANMGTDRLEIMSRNGQTRILLDRIDGERIGKVNFVLRDSRGRIWITVSTRADPWSDAICSRTSDGYVILMDERGARIVADNISFTNEVRLDAAEEWLYIAETCGKRISRMRIRPDGSLGDREIYGPTNLGRGLPDGIAFDAYGNLWVAMVFADRLIAITPEGETLELLDQGNAAATDRFEAEFATGRPVSLETMSATGGGVAPWLSSVTFGGSGLRTVYLGSLKATAIPYFTAPVAGLPLVHWVGRARSLLRSEAVFCQVRRPRSH